MNRARGGFTLVEVLIVLAVLVLLVGLVLPRLDGMLGRTRAARAADEVEAFLFRACEDAAAAGASRFVSFARGLGEVRSETGALLFVSEFSSHEVRLVEVPGGSNAEAFRIEGDGLAPAVTVAIEDRSYRWRPFARLLAPLDSDEVPLGGTLR